MLHYVTSKLIKKVKTNKEIFYSLRLAMLDTSP